MQKYAEYFFLEIAPHPSDGSDFLQHLWKTHRGRLRGAVLAPGTGRIAALSSDGVVGMASILLYEENTVPPLMKKLSDRHSGRNIPEVVCLLRASWDASL